MAIRVVICDDQDVVREGLRTILKSAADIEVVGLAGNGTEALELISARAPDVVLMDLKMPGMNGIQATREIAARFPRVRVLVLTTYDADQWVFDAIRSGAAGYILKDTPRDGLVQAIKDTAAGRTAVDPDVAGKLFNHVKQSPAEDADLTAGLSEREREVLDLIARGLSNADIAARLYLSEGTVRNYVSGVFTKLDVSDRTQAAVLALRSGLARTRDL
jgi:NarL family two-component system response regulator LiaR